MAADLEQLAQIADRFDRAVDRLGEALAKQSPHAIQSTITLNAGGVGLWVAVSACAVMLAVNMGLAILVLNHDRKIDDLSHYLNAIYQLAPSLKPEKE